MKDLTKSEIINFLKNNREAINSYGVRKIGLFGSYVRNRQSEKSDIDILVEFEPRNIPGLIMLSEMERYLQRLRRKKVDVVIKSGIRPELKKGILKEVVYI